MKFFSITAVLLLSAASSNAFQTTPHFGRILSNNNNKKKVHHHQTSSSSLFVATEPEAKEEELLLPGTADVGVAWEDLGFQFRETKSHLRMTWKEGEGWGPMELHSDPYLPIHMGATALHYGQSAFEGLKAFAHEDNQVYIFRPDENAKRINSSARRIMMPEIPEEMFIEACKKVTRDNIGYVPPFGSHGALYLRPLLFGSGSRIGLQPADEYTFVVIPIPVGDYYAGGLSQTVNSIIVEDFDRAAPKGVGAVKVAGNYAADLLPNSLNKKKGFPISLYLDAATHSVIEEFSTSNFIGISQKDKTYVTPRSGSVLPSITNKSLMQLAKDNGYNVEERAIQIDELENFDEIIACGTAVIVTSVGSIYHESQDKTYKYADEVPEVTNMLYQKVREIQFGEVEDQYGWMQKV